MVAGGARAVAGVAVGSVGVLTGAVLALRPALSSGLVVPLVITGMLVGAILDVFRSGGSPTSRTLAAVQVVAALMIAGWPDVPLAACAVVVGVVLVVCGAVDVWIGLFRQRTWTVWVPGLLSIVLGVMAALWVAPTVLPMLAALGTRLVLLGCALVADVWYPARTQRDRSLRLVGRLVGLVLAVALVGAGFVVDPPRATVPDFYTRVVPSGTAAGTLLRAEGYSGQPPGSSAVRLLYATTADDGTAVPASAVLYVPASSPTPRLSVVVWAHGTVGIDRGCAPSLLGVQTGGLSAEARLLAAGYAVLAPDVVGLGTAGPSSYLVGGQEGRSVLDAIRAAGQVPGVRLGASVLWGYSQGGHAALWAAQLASTYAPDLEVSGVVALDPVTDLAAVLAADVSAGHAGTIGAYLLPTYATRYPDVAIDDYTRANPALLAEIDTHCGSGRGVLGSAWASASGLDQSWTVPAATTPLGRRLAENTPSGPFAAPVLVLQGSADDEVSAVAQDDWVDARCSAGQPLGYQKLDGVGRSELVAADGAAVTTALSWTADRFAGRPAAADCG